MTVTQSSFCSCSRKLQPRASRRAPGPFISAWRCRLHEVVNWAYGAAFPRRRTPGLCVIRPPSGMRGRGECRVKASPMARLQNKKQAAVTTGLAESSGIPCAMVLTLIARSPWGPGFLAPIARGARHAANLTSASGGQDHTPSPSAPALLVSHHHRVHRIPASTSVTTRTPLSSRRDGVREAQFSVKRKPNFDARLGLPICP